MKNYNINCKSRNRK